MLAARTWLIYLGFHSAADSGPASWSPRAAAPRLSAAGGGVLLKGVLCLALCSGPAQRGAEGASQGREGARGAALGGRGLRRALRLWGTLHTATVTGRKKVTWFHAPEIRTGSTHKVCIRRLHTRGPGTPARADSFRGDRAWGAPAGPSDAVCSERRQPDRKPPQGASGRASVSPAACAHLCRNRG